MSKLEDRRIPAAREVAAGKYGCTNCGFRLELEREGTLPPCPECGNAAWYPKDGG